MSKINATHYFKGAGLDATLAEYNAGTAQQWRPLERTSGRLFGCKVGNGSTFPTADVKMTVWDSNLRSDFCNVRLTLIDNQGGCGATSQISITGEVNAVTGDKMANVEVSLNAALQEYPIATMTDKEGKYTFNTVPIGVDYSLSATKKDDYLNGVNTLDLVKIQRHILGLKKLEDGYKMIAADADNDQAIRVSDLVELRKLILGVNETLPNNASWRFVDGAQNMGETPWPFNEVIGHAEVKANVTGDRYMGVKIGDVDGGAQANATSTSTQDRSTGIKFSMEDRNVKAGETVTVEMKASEFTQVYGFQLSAKLNGLTLVNAEGRGIDLDNTNAAMLKNNIMTMSWSSAKAETVANDSKVMILTFKASQSGMLSEMIKLTSDVTSAEAYIGESMEVRGVSLEVRNGRDVKFNVSQNEPNPWKGETTIKYELPKAGPVTISIYDITGRDVLRYVSNGKVGQNAITLTKEQLKEATGVMIYKIESGDYTAQKKMIVID